MINTRVNNIRQVHEEKEFVSIEKEDGMTAEELESNIVDLLKSGISKDLIKDGIIPHLGFKFSSLPDSIKSLIK
jgi:hypothetical protein